MSNDNRRTGRAILAALVLALTAPRPASPQDTVVDSRWAAQPPVLDGQPGEWPRETLALLKKLSIEYAFRNDDRDLYVVLVFRDPKSLSSIGATGLKVSARPEGAGTGTNSVLFVGRTLDAEAYLALLEGRGVALTEKEKEYLRIQPLHPVFEAYTVDPQGKTVSPPPPGQDVDPPTFRAAKAGEVITYELKIPLAAPGKHPAGIGAAPGQTVRVSFEWGGTSKESLSAKANFPTTSSIMTGGAVDENQESRAQVFLSAFDRMSSPTLGTKKHSFQAVVRLAEAR